jgi:hypothetical protein
MSMKDRLLASGQSVAEVAARAETPTAHLYNILNRVRRPRPELAMRLEIASHGVLRATELLGIESPSSSSPPAAA